MRYLRQNTATIVTVGPFLDKGDGVTLETGLTITNERISLTVDANDGSAPTLVLDNVTGATSGTANDLNYITNCDAGLMQLELAAANVNYVGRAFLTITDAANHCPVFHEFTILPANVYDAMIGTDKLLVDVSELSSDATAADNAEAFFDGTGYAGTNNVIPTVTTVNQLAANAVTSMSIASNAIDADAIATDAVTEIQTGLATAANLATVDTVVDAIKVKTDYLPSATAGAAGGVFIAGANAATSVTTALTANITGNLSGSAGSVTGAVGSVTGNVGGNVTGSVGSVAGAVASVTAGVTVTTNNDKTGYALSAAGIQAVWDALSSALTAVGSIGKRLVDYLTGDAFARLGAPAGASVSADVAAVKSDTAAILTDTGTTLDTLIKDVPTVAEFEARTLVAADYTVVGDLPTPPTVGAIADQVWDEPIVGHAGAGSTGAALSAATAPTAAQVRAEMDSNSTQLAAIVADTNELQTDWHNGGRLDLILDAATAPTVGAIDTQLSATHGAGLWGGASGSGATSTVITVNDGTNPLDGCEVWVTTDSAGVNLVASGVTDALGQVTFLLDAGTYYVWKQLGGYNFSNPETMVVS